MDAREEDDEQRDEGTSIMLVVSRKLGERIRIGKEIEVVVVKIDRNQIRLGVAAPRDVEVYRHEIAPPGRRTSAKRPKRSPNGDVATDQPRFMPGHPIPNPLKVVSSNAENAEATTVCESAPLGPIGSTNPAV